MKTGSSLLISIALFVMATACHLPTSSTAGSGRSLAIQVGYTPTPKSQSASARLLLQTSTWAVVTLTNSSGVSQQVSQALSGLGKDSFSFSNVALGKYTVSAQAYSDSSESTLLFSNSVPFTFTNLFRSVPLYLLPMVTSSYNASSQSGTAVTGSVPVGGTVTLKYYLDSNLSILTFTGLPTSVPYYLQNTAGAALTDSSGIILGGATAGTLYLTIYNTSGTTYSYNITEVFSGL